MTQHKQIQEFEDALSTYDAQAALQGAAPFTAEAAAPRPQSARTFFRRVLMVGVAVAALGAAGYFGHGYWTVGRFAVSTDDAYVKADNTTIAPKVAGYIAAVFVADNEKVKAGQILARIDDRDFKVAVEQASADVAAARAAIGNKQAAIVAQQSVIDAAAATVTADEANQTFAEQENKRYTDLASTGFGSVQNAQQANSRVLASRANVSRDRAALANSTRLLDVFKAELAQAQANLLRAQAAQDQAELNLSYTTISAPVDGQVGNRTLRVGQYVQAGTQLMSVVPVDSSYVVANYKETQLTDVHAGQPVEIEVDMFPGQVFKGRVDSVAPASGQEFAVLPPDNATGNFTKVVQRIPVKITFDAGSPLPAALRPGMSVVPTIDTRGESEQVATASNARG
ncbi:HlyD family secretion protein [Rhodoblastus sp.]|uniref:HlyD family secretion protein n=1 Tax=Rhodoblastus sp. TaxID=1962975 RepID=UPI0035AEE2B7